MYASRWVKREHLITRRLFDRYERINLAAARKKEALFRRLRGRLEAHARVVGGVLEAAEQAAGPGSLGAQAERLFERIRGLGRLLDEIALLSPDERPYDSKIRLLRDYVDVQIQGDEAALLAEAQRRLGRKRLRDLGARVEQAYRALQRDGAA